MYHYIMVYMTKKKRPVKPVTKPLSWWQKFKKFAFTFNLTPENIQKALKIKRPKAEGRRPKARIRRGGEAIFYSLGFIGLLVIIGIYLFKDIPSPTKLASGSFPVSTQIFDRNGNLLYEIYAEQNRTPVVIDALPDYVLQATISIEDKNFYRHLGVDLSGIARAAYKNFSGQRLEGDRKSVV